MSPAHRRTYLNEAAGYFFDRDNTLIANNGYLGDPQKVILLDGAADAVARARSLGFATVVISNQSGVARGLFSEDDVSAVNRRMDEMLLDGNASAVIDRHEFCPFHPEATVEAYREESDRRKPRAGMILEAADKLALDLSRSWVIGDAPRDIEAGQTAGCRTILIRHKDLSASPAAAEASTVEAEFTVATLKEAIDFVALHLNEAAPAGAGRLKISRNGSANPPDRLEVLADQILSELKRRNETHHYSDFSITKLLAGITQVVALAVVMLAYLKLDTAYFLLMTFALFLQLLTIALLLMHQQRP